MRLPGSFLKPFGTFKHRLREGGRVLGGSDWKGTVSASAKLLLRGVRDPAGAFGLLKSVAGGLGGSDWKATVSTSAKLLLWGVRGSADASGPLQSVAGVLCFVLENYQVCFPRDVYPQYSQAPQRTDANKQAIESLAPQIKALAESLRKPVSADDEGERERRQKLER